MLLEGVESEAILVLAFIVILTFVYWNIRLQNEVQKRRIIEQALKESEEKFRTLFDISPVLLDSFDETGRCTLWNKECEKVFGWTKEELNAHENSLALFYPDEKDQQKVIESFINNEGEYLEWYPITKDGKQLVTMWANIKLPNGEVINIGYDITEQRKSEKALEELNNSLEERVRAEIEKNEKHQFLLMQQNKLAQMGEMIENIAHQWRQPLAQVNSSVLLIDATLKKHGFQDEFIESKLLEIESLTGYMSKTIDDFRNFFDMDKEKKDFTLEEIIENALQILKGVFRSNKIQVDKKVDKRIQCHGHPNELQQVVVIILNNAKDALVQEGIENPQIEIIVDEDRQNYSIEICDNAGGVAEDSLEKVFQPYFTTKHQSKGVGLGLYMAKMIIEDGLTGSLSVKNRKKGACFTIILPKESV